MEALSEEDIDVDKLPIIAIKVTGTSGEYDWDRHKDKPKVDYLKALAALEKLSLEELFCMGDIYSSQEMEASSFILDLYDAMIMMFERIVERYPNEWHLSIPSSFPEREIYDSVVGIMEDEQLEELNVLLDGNAGETHEVERVAKKLFSSLEDYILEQSNLAETIALPGAGKSIIL